MDDIPPPPEYYPEMLTPRNLVLYVVIREYFHMHHILLDPSISEKDRQSGLNSSQDKYVFYLHLLEMLDDEHVDPLASVRSQDSPLKRFLSKLVHMKLREFIPSRISTKNVDARNASLMNQLNSGVLSLQFYMAPEALNHLLSPARRLYNFDELAFTRNSVFGLFMRRVNLAFNSMSFEKSLLFLERFTQYILNGTEEETSEVDDFELQKRQALTLEAQELGGFQDEFDGTHTQPDVPDDEVAPFTPEQARAFVRDQVRLLYVCPNGALRPVEMALKLSHYCRRFPMMPELAYLRYLNAVRTQDVCAAEHALHHFVALKASDLTSGEASDSLYTYAALSAARLHKELGHKQLARQAEQEALDKALLAKDGHLLVLMRSIHPLLNAEEKCPVLGEFETSLTGNQPEKKELAIIDLRHNMREMLGNGSRPSELFLQFYLSVLPDMAESTHTLNVELASLWDFYGFPLLGDVFTQCCLLYDPSRSHARTLLDEAFVAALCRQLRRLEVLPNDEGASGGDGADSRSQHLLSLLDRHVVHLPQRRLCERVRREAEFDRAWLQGRWPAAWRCAQALRLLDWREAALRSAFCLKGCGNRQEAHRLADELLAADDGGAAAAAALSGAMRARLLLAEMALDARTPHLLALHVGVCRDLARRRHAHGMAAWLDFYEACGLLQEDPEAAGAKLAACKGLLLAGSGLFDSGRLHWVDGLWRLQRWRQRPKEEETAEEDLSDALRLLNTALSSFEAVGAVKRVRATAALLALLHEELVGRDPAVHRRLRNRFAELAVSSDDRGDESPAFEIPPY